MYGVRDGKCWRQASPYIPPNPQNLTTYGGEGGDGIRISGDTPIFLGAAKHVRPLTPRGNKRPSFRYVPAFGVVVS